MLISGPKDVRLHIKWPAVPGSVVAQALSSEVKCDLSLASARWDMSNLNPTGCFLGIYEDETVFSVGGRTDFDLGPWQLELVLAVQWCVCKWEGAGLEDVGSGRHRPPAPTSMLMLKIKAPALETSWTCSRRHAFRPRLPPTPGIHFQNEHSATATDHATAQATMASPWQPDPRRHPIPQNPATAASTNNGDTAPGHTSLGRCFTSTTAPNTANQPKGMTIAPIRGVDRSSNIFPSPAARSHNDAGPANHGFPSMGSLDAMPGASPRIASTTSAADAVPEHLANCSISIMFGPPNAPDQNVMAAGVVSKLPKKVLAVIARSNSRTESKIAENSMLICFSSHYWHKNLEKVNQYLTTGDYSPWKPPVPLEIVNKKGRKAAWEPWMAEAADIDDASTTEDTYELFKGELSLYLWACYTRYDELKAHSFQKLQFEFPILGREALHLVEFICYTSSNNLPAEEDMKQFTSDAVEKNKKQVALQPQFTKMFEKAIGNNLAAKLLAGAQRDRLLSLEAESFVTGLKKETGLLHIRCLLIIKANLTFEQTNRTSSPVFSVIPG